MHKTTSSLDVVRYPAGEVTVRGAEDTTAILMDDPSPEGLIATLEAANQAERPVTLVAGYVPSARADKPGNYDIPVVAKIIATGNFSKVIVADVHSQESRDVLAAELQQTGIDMVELSAADILALMPEWWRSRGYTAVVAPDAGAVPRARRVAEMMGLPVAVGSKVRNQATGRITSYSFNSGGANLDRVLVVDDICDGGATFAILREALPGEADLYVTHGVFSGNAAQNLSGYDRIFTTTTLATARNLKRPSVTLASARHWATL